MALTWETTDQFGNLVVANSSAQSVEELKSDLADLVKRVFDRHADEQVTISVDFEYGEISAPRGDQVSHMVQIPWLADSGLSFEDVSGLINEVKENYTFQIIGPWPM